jgi:glycerophosphoryl diester phosphodiesterase
MLCFGHRGARGHAPENTVRSVRTALALGATWVEVDVHAVEGELVVIHDESLERTTNGRGPVAEATLAELRRLDAGDGERIPTLAEVFDAAAAGGAGVNVELKGAGTEALVAAFARRRIALGWLPGRILVSSFDRDRLERVRALAPEIPRGVLVDEGPVADAAFAEALGACAVHPRLDVVSEALVADAHRRGLGVHVFTVNESADIARMIDLGVDGVFTDYPDRVAAALRARGHSST